ncbi:MFS transporter [Actinomadura xylanilytica]|uniref:MFS transporter n=1 Tax=Actinomadura xylanilytica TaxID=887459 RepID=UPI00255B2634|nr:MFS transporter [Actinomadura xylanilytica]MDL4773086.1 MFS transporter [Actinomadura xylanilytica]
MSQPQTAARTAGRVAAGDRPSAVAEHGGGGDGGGGERAAERGRGGAMVAVLAFSGIVVAVMQTLLVPIIAELPRLLSTSPANATWVMTSTLLAGAVATPIMGRLGDLFGKRRMLLTSLALMVAGSLVAALSSELVPVVAGRALQGFAMGAIPLGISIMRDELPPQRLGSAMGLMSSSIGIGGALGLPGAALVAQHADWHALFYTSAGLGVLSMLLTVLVVPESGSRPGGRFDILGALGLTAGLISLLLPVTKGDQWGWGSPRTLGFFAGAAVIFVLWALMELRVDSPLVDLRTTARRQVLLTNLASVMIGVAFYAMSVVLPQVMELPTGTGYGLGTSLVVAGLAMAPMGVAMMLVSPLSARLSAARGPKTSLMLGLVIIATGYGAGIFLMGALWQILITVTVIGIGIGFAYSALPALIIAAVPVTETGAANGLNALARSVGTSVSSAVVGMVLARMTTSFGGTELPTMNGFRATFLIATAASLGGLAMTFFLPARKRAAAASAQQPAAGRPDADQPAAGRSETVAVRPHSGVAGRVLSGDRPIEGAAVTLIDAQGRQVAHTVGDADGRYTLDVPETGRFLLVGSATGHRPEAAPLTVGAGPIELDLVLTCAAGLHGTVRDAAAGTPLPDATVVVTDAGGEVVASAASGDGGGFELPELPPGGYTLAARAARHRPSAVPVTVPADTGTRHDLALEPAGAVTGTVRGNDGRTLDDIRVSLMDRTGNVIAVSYTGRDGAYAFKDVAGAEYTLVASGYAPVTAPVTLTGHGLDSVDLKLSHQRS